MSTFPPLPPPPPAQPRKKLWPKIAIAVVVFGFVAGALLWKTGKSAYGKYQIASAAVDRFHEQLNGGNYDAIYANGTDEFRGAGKREDLNHFFDNIREKMGNAGKRSGTGFHVNWRNGVVWVDQTFTTQFDKGQAQEFFVWQIQQDQPHLYRYRIDSPLMQNSPATK